MKWLVFAFMVSFLVVCCGLVCVFGDPPMVPPPPPGGGHGGGTNQTGAPVDGGFVYLLIAGTGYGLIKIAGRMRKDPASNGKDG